MRRSPAHRVAPVAFICSGVGPPPTTLALFTHRVASSPLSCPASPSAPPGAVPHGRHWLLPAPASPRRAAVNCAFACSAASVSMRTSVKLPGPYTVCIGSAPASGWSSACVPPSQPYHVTSPFRQRHIPPQTALRFHIRLPTRRPSGSYTYRPSAAFLRAVRT